MSFRPPHIRNPFAVHEARVDAPTVAALSLPRVLFANDTVKQAITQGPPSPGMFLINAEHGYLEQWVMDHWEKVGHWAPGDPSEDPLANVQVAQARPAFIPGGGGTAPAPGGDVTTPANPVDSSCTPIFQDPDPGAVGAGKFWYDTGSDQLFIRNAGNNGWIEICLV
jgi:hypothetical protein